MPSTASDTLIGFVFYAGVAILGISVIMMLFVILFRLWSLARNRTVRRFRKRWEEVLTALDHTIPPNLPKIRPNEQFLFLQLWSDRYEKAEPMGRNNLLELAAHLKLGTIAAEMLQETSGDHKMLAMRTLAHLKSDAGTPTLMELLKHPNPLFSLLAARTLVRIEEAAALDLLMPYFVAKKEWQANKILLILEGIEPEVIAPVLTDAIDYTPLPQLPRLIRFFTLMPTERARHEALLLLQRHTDPEIIAACLHHTNHPEDKRLLTEYLSHETWIVRMHAVKALAPLLTAPDIALLFPLLIDPAWWVRFHTARTIVMQPFADEKYLDTLDANLVDRYAKDALHQARSRRSIFEHL